MSSDSDRDSSVEDEDYAPSGGDDSEEEEDVGAKNSGTEGAGEEGPSKEEVDKIWNDFKADVAKDKKTNAQTQENHKDVQKTDSAALNDEPKNTNIVKSPEMQEMNGKTEEVKDKKKTVAEEKKTVTVTKIYDFAGEEVKVTKEVDRDSKEARNHLGTFVNDTKQTTTSAISRVKRPGGLQGVLGKLGKKPKLSTLEKSKLDWQNYKELEGIQDELKTHNKGKEGYLEKQSFLQRTDFRQFEREREMRLGRTSKR